MRGNGDIIRLSAALVVSAALVAAIFQPNAGRRAIDRAAAAAASAAASIEQPGLVARGCAPGAPAFVASFAPLEDILSVSPLGGITAPGEVLPAPYIRLNTRRGDTAFERRSTIAQAPARADITAIERRRSRGEDGRVDDEHWTVHFQICESISFYYDRLDVLDEGILHRAGGLSAFEELGGPDHLAVAAKIRVAPGDPIGVADGFDIGLHDGSLPPASLERPERYRENPYARAAIFDAPPGLIEAISPDQSRARCALDYLPAKLAADWSSKLGDSWGVRRAKGDDACRTALVDTPGAAKGVWYTDPAHNAAATKVSAVALSADTIDPDRLIFALHGRLASLTPDMIALSPFMEEERAEASRDFISFRAGDGRINTAFKNVEDGRIYCYEKLRANFVGPQINGVILLERSSVHDGPALLKIEARGDARSCVDLAEPWTFSGGETVFYR